MKNLIVLIGLAFFSCAMVEPDYNWYSVKKLPKEIEWQYNNIVNFNSDMVVDWVIENINYKLYANGFHPVQQTLKERQGNCANRALTSIALWYKLTGHKGQLVYCWYNDGKQSFLHYAAKLDGSIYESKYITQVYEIIDFDDIAEYIYYRQ